jgi:hypothetical protein
MLKFKKFIANKGKENYQTYFANECGNGQIMGFDG